MRMYSKAWLKMCVETGREYWNQSKERFEEFIEANGFAPEHEEYIRKNVCG